MIARCVALAMVVVVSLRGAEIKLPAESARLAESKLPGYSLAVTYCFTCHSTDYVIYQPSSTARATWRASVIKMQKTFGAPIPDSAVDPIAEYLAQSYGAERAKGQGKATEQASQKKG
jgi:hypothetical protein